MAGKSLYEKKYCKAMIDYFDIEPFTTIDIPHFGKDGMVKWVDKKRVTNKLPTMRNFAKHIGVNYSTVYKWKKDFKEFSNTFKECKKIRKWFIIENGMNGLYNPAFAIFVAKNVTDMTDSQELVQDIKVTNVADKDQQKKIAEEILYDNRGTNTTTSDTEE